MPVPNSFANVTTSIPLSQLDANFNTPITLGNTAIQLGNTVTTLNNMTLANVTISSGNVTITNVSVTTANVTTANIGTEIVTTSQTLNYGTANGVVYLNTSKVSTTGTALVFDGTNLGVGTSSPAQTLHVKTSTAAGPITLGVLSNSTTLPALSFNGAYASSTMAGIYSNGVAASNLYYTVPANQSHFFAVADSTKMTLDSSGNLGLGVTPSAWGSTFKALEFNGGSLSSGASTNLVMMQNAYYDGTNYIYKTTSTASRYWQVGGAHAFFTAPSGTAGNAITFTQAMTLDASGNLGLGVTPSASWSAGRRILQVGTNGALWGVTSGAGSLFLSNNTYFDGTNFRYLNTSGAGYYGQTTDGSHLWNIAASGTAGNPITFTQAMTLDANNVLYVNGTSQIAGSILNVRGNGSYIGVGGSTVQMLFGDNASTEGFLGTLTNHACTFRTNNTERARIDASGFTQFNSNLVMPYQGAPTSKSTTATLTGAELITGILNTTGTSYTVTLPTGTNIEGALTWSANNVSLDWYVINTASGTITIGANGNTTLGSLTIATGTSAHFRIRRTAANTFTVYRL